MEEGLFQILFFAVLIAASMFDAATRRRRRRRKMQEMEGEEGTVDSEQQSGEVAAGPQSSGRTAAPEPSGRRETADSMVPADLWQILTGQQPFPQEPGAEQPRSKTGSPSGSASPPEVGASSEGDRTDAMGRGARGRPSGPESTRRAPRHSSGRPSRRCRSPPRPLPIEQRHACRLHLHRLHPSYLLVRRPGSQGGDPQDWPYPMSISYEPVEVVSAFGRRLS
jgi:hypothetical protein